ncbi:MAG: hypothetical protein H9789_10170 [Candidatus Paraprevotella stercoravium]|uniref:OmpA family protein n=1 Tax=Candidatus Paraprevotella stercoravium TaxID=2838725 RepID=A0A9E2L717_9BACT|nr:hypothetical protein [Candidatus Paraprevotella stercoravium]
MRKLVMGIGMLLLLFGSNVHAQTVVSDTLVNEEIIEPQPTDDRYRVVTNRFWDNWFVLGDFGGHAYTGDYVSVGDFSGTLTPDFNVGIGKWFTPGIGVKAQFGLSNSKGYSKEETYFTYGDPLTAADGTLYWKSKMKWWDININAMFNLSRLIKGYEGKESDELMNQFIASVGIGAVHHRDIPQQRNEWSGHFELQYSRFFDKKKRISLDVKAHAILFQTNFDGIVLKENNENSKWWDGNIGLSVGVTYYIKKRHWDRCIPCQNPVYINNTYLPVPVQDCPEYRTLEFYVFFPNNYSGRDDAPIVAGAPVNAVDYLASGIFTQRKFVDADAVDGRLTSGTSLTSLATEDIPTEKAYRCMLIDGVSRGYEMSESPISLSMDPASMRTFEEKMDYFYAPIYEGGKTWYYRVDKETTTQSLLSDDNYRESVSYGLNAHAGLNVIKENMKVEDSHTALYSFADVYAAIEGNDGYVAQAADSASVKELIEVLKKGRILNIQAEGLATSQDNYIGENAENVGLERNKTLAYNRAHTIIKWLRGNAMFDNVANSAFSISALTDPIVTVNDKSTRGLNAKLNRCVKVRIHCVIDK